MKVRKVNGARGIYGNITLNQPIDNSLTLEVVALKKQGNEYRQLDYKFEKKPFCDFVTEYTIVYENNQATHYTDFPSQCPVNAVSCEPSLSSTK